MVLGLLMFRMLYRYLSAEDFGFWSLLWSVFGYGVLVDFGLGFAAQKQVAELSVKQDWDRLSQILSTIIYFFTGVAMLIIAGAFLGADFLLGWFKVSPENLTRYRTVLLIFFGGLALGFPLGVFPEILRGRQKISAVNTVASVGLIANFVLQWLAIEYDWGLSAVLMIALGCTIGPDLVCGFLAFRDLPELRIRPSLFSWNNIGSTLSFSVFAYLITATNLVLGKTDQLVISSLLSVAAVAVYVAGAKVSEMFSLFTRQLQEALSPAAAHLHASGETAALQALLVQGTRLSVLISTPLYLLCAAYLRELISLLTSEKNPPAQTVWVGQILLFWYYTTILTHSVSKRIFVMIGHERRLMWLGVGEAIANLGLSVVLILTMHTVASVAIGSLIPTLFVGWVYLWPWVARDVGLTGWALFRTTTLPIWIGCVPMLGILAVLRTVPFFLWQNPLLTVLLQGGITFAVGIAGLWQFALNDGEREKFRNRLRSPKARTARPLAPEIS
jgi:O-antigen/teichoic acid export membrane protein